jgi:polysaccharide biosynthesis transport protein
MSSLVLRDAGVPAPIAPRFPTPGSTHTWLHQTVGTFQSKWKLALVTAAVAFTLIAGAGFLMPRSQYAEATLVVHPAGSDNPAQPDVQQSSLPPDTSAIDTEVEVLRSAAVAQTVATNLKLYLDPEFGGSATTRPIDPAMKNVIAAVEAHSRIRRIGLTYVVQVGFLASTSDKAKLIGNGIVDAYLTRKLGQKVAAISLANRDLGSTLGALRLQATETQAQVEQYEAQNHLLGPNGTSLIETELSNLNQQIAQAQADAAEKQARLGAAEGQAKSGTGGSDVGATLASQTIGALRQKEAETSAQLSQLQTEFRSDYPAVQKTQAQLDDIRKQLRSETTRILSSLRADADVASRREASLVASRQQTEGSLVESNQARTGLLALQQAADSSKKVYETYLSRATEMSAARSLQQVDATVESRAIAAPGSPFTSLRFILAVGAILAMIAGMIAVMLSEMWNKRIRSWNDVTLQTGFPLAGVLPDVSKLARTKDPANHIATNPLTACAEAIRNLRTFLAISAPKAKVIAVTSAVPGEGKTLTSVCLARMFAASGARVVLLDADLRRASASKFFPKPKFGIAEIVDRSVPIEHALIHDSKSGIWFLSGSAAHEISGELFSSHRTDELIQALAQQFDKVIIDTSPLLGFADARILASKADCVLHVVHWDKTPTTIVHAAVEILRQSHARVAGIVLNKVNVKQQARYGFADGSEYFHRYAATYGQQA